MADLTPAQLHVLQHSLGLDDYGRGTRYRNYFATDPDSDDGPTCTSLVELGLMGDHGARAIAGGMHVYFVTPLGEAAVVAQSPKPPKVSRSKARYLAWLSADSGVPFGEWIRYRREDGRAR